jgi:hypothetical protein
VGEPPFAPSSLPHTEDHTPEQPPALHSSFLPSPHVVPAFLTRVTTFFPQLRRHPDPNGSGSPAPEPAHNSQEWIEIIEDYLDGVLSPASKAQFEASLAVNSALRTQLEETRAAHEALAASLRRSFQPEIVPLPQGEIGSNATNNLQSTDPASIPFPTSTPVKQPTLLQRLGWLRIAAIVAICAFAGVTFTLRRITSVPLIAPEASYALIVKEGFRPYQICTTDEEFALYTTQTLGVALRVPPLQGLTLIGWKGGSGVMSERTDALLATKDDSRIIVYFDTSGNERSLPSRVSTPDGELRIFQRTTSGISLVEVTPLDQPVIISRMEVVKAGH